ncbi:ABC transporter ATP-binding protein [Elizabethkingia meningoseptica]|uniref:ABC transporter ATP-binding protein n=1 Tax=Elizabethkingia meningoseptica TaxID=238 RepID=UPI000B35D919|nr:ABC transporter ATP-binding protein [Elizabethkingia meningoseptica]MDE5436782.1 ABC transporter ATP-binding protein [Elizabethkingia meningoseptica]MDE5509192.1 ABC transporter ATP-binding protein [Elizabethkingia meningoseptica]MDE5514709.1 ABC transporter ATP-binding protein [Elizabethkingia meningoseptica]MDE5525395.1 ABC transporter ATP-binding protein [Elizabethkingia meningoseptica]MDE5528974.1 ABC transporter ATP-binding protein [Elizabethkingia meningoseptica]
MENTIEIKDLNFSFNKGKPILKNLNLAVPKGSVFGFLGANGAGKSTTMRFIIGALTDADQSIRIFNQQLYHFYPEGFNKIGSLIDYPAFYDHLSGWDNLMILVQLRQLPRKNAEDVLHLVGLWDARNTRMKKYSLGMKQRLAIAMSLLGNPELLILDEPVNGLDPNGMIEIRELLLKLNREKGITIFISSHLLQEIEKMITHLAIISNGEIKFTGSKEELNLLYQYNRVKIGINNARQFLNVIPAGYNPQLIDENSMECAVTSKEEVIQLNTLLVSANAEIFELKSNTGLEDWFIELTKN